MKAYIKIKEELLQREDIEDVLYDTNEKTLTIIPNQNESFFRTGEPIKDYIVDVIDINKNTTYPTRAYKIGDRVFKFKYSEFFNTQIYYIKLKDITSDSLRQIKWS